MGPKWEVTGSASIQVVGLGWQVALGKRRGAMRVAHPTKSGDLVNSLIDNGRKELSTVNKARHTIALLR